MLHLVGCNLELYILKIYFYGKQVWKCNIVLNMWCVLCVSDWAVMCTEQVLWGGRYRGRYVYCRPAHSEHMLIVRLHARRWTINIHTIPFAVLVQYTTLTNKKHNDTHHMLLISTSIQLLNLFSIKKFWYIYIYIYILFYLFLKLFMYLYIYRTRSSWIICEVVTSLYAYGAYN